MIQINIYIVYTAQVANRYVFAFGIIEFAYTRFAFATAGCIKE